MTFVLTITITLFNYPEVFFNLHNQGIPNRIIYPEFAAPGNALHLLFLKFLPVKIIDVNQSCLPWMSSKAFLNIFSYMFENRPGKRIIKKEYGGGWWNLIKTGIPQINTSKGIFFSFLHNSSLGFLQPLEQVYRTIPLHEVS